MTRRALVLVFLALLWPMPAAASDPTGLFVVFVGFPAVVISIVVLVSAFFAPRFGLFACITLLLVLVPILEWARDGWSESARGPIYLSMGLNAAGILVSFLKIAKAAESKGETRS